MRVGSWPAAADRGRVGERRPVHPFRHEHVAAGQFPEHRRHAEIILAGDIVRHLRICGRLEPKIHFEDDAALEDLDHGNRLQPARLRRIALDEVRSGVEGLEVAGEALPDAGPQDLDRHRLAWLARHRLVDLRDRRRGDRFGEVLKQGIDRGAEAGFHRGPRLNGRKRRQVVLQRGERLRHLHADDVRPCRQELPELDVGGPEPVHRRGDAPPPLGAGHARAARRGAPGGRGAAAASADRRAP